MARPAMVQVQGMRQLARTLNQSEDEIDTLKQAHTAVARLVAQAAAGDAPKRTGALAGTARPAQQKRRARVYWGRAAVPYGGPIHYGWPARNIRPQPFVSGAAVRTQTIWVGMYRSSVDRSLERVKGA